MNSQINNSFKKHFISLLTLVLTTSYVQFATFFILEFIHNF